ncbi:hypothetical protein NQ317_003264 [Molorchus minor]|uniref:RRM domain-containing protein n=1 Tax=Molorchus minor TaxID=1323400 RepID=A0ABQ9JLH7_9CUCU|nr:hypothetical protein NQ317_003264 [Molorchus minor]
MNGKVISNGGRIVSRALEGTPTSRKNSATFVWSLKSMTDSELYDYFKQFGKIDYASIIKDKSTRESKGFAYVKYTKFSFAATAFEQCGRKHKPVFAEPRKTMSHVMMIGIRHVLTAIIEAGRHCRVRQIIMGTKVIASPVNQDQLWKLFDIVPEMDYCQLKY